MAIEAGGAIRSRGFAIDPYRACLGLAAAGDGEEGADLRRRRRCTRVRDRRSAVEIVTGGGTLRAETVIVATAARLPDLRALRRHLRPLHSYAVVTEPLAASVRRELGRAGRIALKTTRMPPHRVRWLDDDRVLVSGADQPAVAARLQAQVLTQRAGQLMYELSVLYPAISGTMPAWAWQQACDATVDGLPCIGPHRNFPRHFFALGQATSRRGVAWLTARLASRWVLGKPEKTDEIYGFSRIL